MLSFEIDISIKLQSDLHTAGPGRVLPLVDRSIEVDVKGNPVISAASIRGRVRAQMERLLDALGENVCQPPDPAKMCPHAAPGQVPDTHCHACKIFGNAWKQSQVFFSDFTIRDGSEQSKIESNTRTGIGINRLLNTVEEKKLFVIETVPRSLTVFEGQVCGWLSRQDIAWLLAAIKSLTHFGGGKGRGLGRVVIDIETIRVCLDDKAEMKEVEMQDLLSEVFAR